MHELADRILLTPSGLTRVVDRMVDAGLVRREQCRTDRRVYYATLTDRGHKRLQKTSPVHLRGVEEHFTSHLTDREAEVLRKALGKVLADIRPDLAERIAQ
jgi:DNA-binding MarR family transcriptional regulator